MLIPYFETLLVECQTCRTHFLAQMCTHVWMCFLKCVDVFSGMCECVFWSVCTCVNVFSGVCECLVTRARSLWMFIFIDCNCINDENDDEVFEHLVRAMEYRGRKFITLTSGSKSLFNCVFYQRGRVSRVADTEPLNCEIYQRGECLGLLTQNSYY